MTKKLLILLILIGIFISGCVREDTNAKEPTKNETIVESTYEHRFATTQ